MVRSGEVVSEALEHAEIVARDGTKCRLGSLWQDGPVVLVFLRHFACIACTEHVAVLSPRLSELEDAGVKVVFIGNGAPNFIEGFIERNGLDRGTVVLTDPSLSVFRAVGLERSRLSTYGPRAAVNAGRAMLRGLRQKSIEGDVLQQGGVLVVGRGGRVEYVHRDRVLGDHAPLPEIMAAAQAVADSRDRA
jgi:peroxiredoxin